MKRFCDLKKGDKIYKIDLLIPKIKELDWRYHQTGLELLKYTLVLKDVIVLKEKL